MRQIERTTQFRRDFRRELKGRHARDLNAALAAVIEPLIKDVPLSLRYRDHPLSGEWRGFRDCHVRPDLVLIYELPDDDTLRLVRLGSHSELGW
jgi:mRNA interferase YafQ